MAQLRVGQLLDGYCGGEFMLGPDSVRVEAIGVDWAVVRAVDTYDTEWANPQLYVGPPDDLMIYARSAK